MRLPIEGKLKPRGGLPILTIYYSTGKGMPFSFRRLYLLLQPGSYERSPFSRNTAAGSYVGDEGLFVT